MGVVAHVSNPSTQEVEVGILPKGQGQQELHSEILSRRERGRSATASQVPWTVGMSLLDFVLIFSLFTFSSALPQLSFHTVLLRLPRFLSMCVCVHVCVNN